VQVLLWGIFVLNLIFGYIRLPEFDHIVLKDTLLVICIFASLIFGFNLLIPNLSRGDEIEKVKQEINSIKANEDVFDALLKKQPYYEVSKADSQILFGNPDAGLVITVFTNPFCNPCAKMHKRIEKLLHETNRNTCVQYLFSSFEFESDLNFANKYLIATYLQKEQSEFEQIIADWFEKGKSLKEAFFNDLHLDMENPDIEAEFKKHEVWKEKEKSQLRSTPTILVNGYKLPENYKIEDLRYLEGSTGSYRELQEVIES